MITYEKILKRPHAADSLIGMSLGDFEKLYAEFELAHTAHENKFQYTRRYQLKRQRNKGAGRKYKYDLRDRLLMTLFWLRAYTTYGLLGSFYKLDRTNVEDNLKNILHILETMATFQVELPQAGVPKLRTFQEVREAFPDIRLMLDGQD